MSPTHIGVGWGFYTLGDMLEMYRGKCELDPVNVFVRAFGNGSKSAPPKPQPTSFKYPLNKDSIGMLKVFFNKAACN